MYFILTDNTNKVMVVTNAYRNCIVSGFQQVVVDARTGIRDIARDIRNKHMNVKNVKTLLLLNSRADFMNGDDAVWVLELLREALREVQYTGKVVLLSPLPLVHDTGSTCREMLEENKRLSLQLQKDRTFHFCDASHGLFNESGPYASLLDGYGLTIQGVCELKQGLVNV